VLLVDDEQPILTVLTRTLRAKGYQVRAVTNGMDALLALSEEIPDVMLLDINLPDLTGWEVLRRLSPTDRARVPVIVFSASPLAPSRVQEFRPAGVLVKPFPVEALQRLLRDVLDAKPSANEVRDA
jgi:two-component system sensor histidine kinase ChiS